MIADNANAHIDNIVLINELCRQAQTQGEPLFNAGAWLSMILIIAAFLILGGLVFMNDEIPPISTVLIGVGLLMGVTGVWHYWKMEVSYDNTAKEITAEVNRARSVISEAFGDLGYVVNNDSICILSTDNLEDLENGVYVDQVLTIDTAVPTTDESVIASAGTLAYLISSSGDVYLYKDGRALHPVGSTE